MRRLSVATIVSQERNENTCPISHFQSLWRGWHAIVPLMRHANSAMSRSPGSPRRPSAHLRAADYSADMTKADLNPPASFTQSIAHQQRAHELIPGGGHTYAKGDDQFAAGLAPVIARGKGSRVWDVDGNEFIEFGSGVRSVTLGHGYPRVCQAAQRALWDGTNFTRPAAIELEAAETFLRCVESAEMVKFAKNGSDATTAAVRLARAVTGRRLVAVCSDQPFFSADDWFMGIVPMNAGIPAAQTRLTVTFPFNDVPALDSLFAEHGHDLACVMLEAQRDEVPAPGYLAALRERCDQFGVLMVIDETIAGFRLHRGGGHALHGVTPDLSTYGKGIANGFSVAALAGKRQFMERGGLMTEEERVFLLSFTHGGETHCLAAAIETMNEVHEQNVPGALAEAGAFLRDRINAAAKAEGVLDHFHVVGHTSNLCYVTKDADGKRSQLFRTLFLQETVKRSLIAPNLVVGFSHGTHDLTLAADRIAEVLPIYRKALEDGVENHLTDRPVKPVFRRFN